MEDVGDTAVINMYCMSLCMSFPLCSSSVTASWQLSSLFCCFPHCIRYQSDFFTVSSLLLAVNSLLGVLPAVS